MTSFVYRHKTVTALAVGAAVVGFAVWQPRWLATAVTVLCVAGVTRVILWLADPKE